MKIVSLLAIKSKWTEGFSLWSLKSMWTEGFSLWSLKSRWTEGFSLLCSSLCGLNVVLPLKVKSR